MMRTIMSSEAYLDSTLSVDERVSDLLSRMTLREKIEQMLQLDGRNNIDDLVLHKHVGPLLHTSWRDQAHAFELTQHTPVVSPYRG